MATLSEIEILGIRSFGPEEGDKQRIKFQKPLTLILGENGCGKSTIIECLRYVSTNKEPSGKGTFIHDPSLTSRSVVKGSIKLGMNDIKNEKVWLCKNLQATRTKKNITTKTLDSCITRRDADTKQKKSISGRCADFNIEVPRIFGISKAILEYVIFCTQEDSHWPLESDMKLKEKFDQVFDSDLYNKCVTRVLRKKKSVRENVSVVKGTLEFLKANKTRAAEKKRMLHNSKNQRDGYNSDIEKCSADIIPIQEELKNVMEAESEIGMLQARKVTKKAQFESAKNSQIELKNRMGVEFKGSDDELKLMISNFKEDLKQRQDNMGKVEDEIRKMDREENEHLKEKSLKEKLLGQLETEEKMHQKEVNDRNRRLTELATELGIDVSGFSQSSEDQMQRLFKEVRLKIREKDEDLVSLQQKADKEDQDLQNEVVKFQKQTMSFENDVANKKNGISNSQNERRDIERKLEEIEQSASKLSRIETQLSKANKELEELQSSTDVNCLKEEIRNLTRERDRLEERLNEIQNEITVLQNQAKISAELDVHLDSKKNKDADIRRLMNKHEDTLTKLLGSVPENNFKAAIQSHVFKLKQRVKELTSNQSRKEKQLTELEMDRKHLKEEISKKENLLRTSEEEIDTECDGNDFQDTLNETKDLMHKLEDNKGILTSSKKMFESYMRQLENRACCPLCHRDFEGQDDVQALIEEMTNKVQDLPNKLEENKADLEEKQGKYSKLLTLKPKYTRISELKNQEIPDLRTKLETTESNLKKTRKELEDLKKEIMEPQKDESTCTSIQGDMALLDQLQSEQKKIEREIEKLETRLGPNKSKGNLQELQKEYEDGRRNLKSTRDRIEELQTKLNRQIEAVQKLQSTINGLMDERSKIHGGVSQKTQLEERREALEASEALESDELDKLNESLKSAENLLKEAKSEKTSVKISNDDKINKMRSLVNNFRKQFDNIETMIQRINNFVEKGIAKKLETVNEAINQLKRKVEDVKRQKMEASKKIEEIKLDLSSQQTKERELEDNLKYREKVKEAEVLRQELEELETRFGSLDPANLMKKKRELKAREEDINLKKAQLQGRLVQLLNQIEELERELRDKTYRTAEEEYSKAFVQYEVLKAVESDLDRYANAMEWALMKYHSTQMSRVNSFIREYWRRIYQGNDIDYIEIKTDEVTGTEKKRNYNYRLVQVKSDVHLDMRNRCSAGQKMLASLIIRMALAETFSGNCGILTLDEPTTNLDRKNIRNLAKTLNEVLTAKQAMGNNNFQLIVITHDEEFVNELMEVDAISEYVKIERTPAGKSRAVLESVEDAAPLQGHGNRNHQQQQQQYDYDDY